jgi:phosphoribosylformylglycinamidine cyclo-ligase
MAEKEEESRYKKWVNYSKVDPYKGIMLQAGRSTSDNILDTPFREVPESRGESAIVVESEELDMGIAFVVEGPGSIEVVAIKMRRVTGEIYEEKVGQDQVASAVNDVTSVGARPLIFNPYWSMHSYDFFDDEPRAMGLINGVKIGSNKGKLIYGGGETQSIPDFVKAGGVELLRPGPEKRIVEMAGGVVGYIKPRSRRTSPTKIMPGDAILLAESNGIHTNAVSEARGVGMDLHYDHPIRRFVPKFLRQKLDDWGIIEVAPGFAAKMDDGRMFGEAILDPSIIYSPLVQDLYKAGIDIHYMVHITGHGWRKLMRPNRDDLMYIVDELPDSQPIFRFIQEQTKLSDIQMYGLFNMGAGYAFYIPEADVEKAQQIAALQHGIKTWKAGHIEAGEKQLVIPRLGLTFPGESLNIN